VRSVANPGRWSRSRSNETRSTPGTIGLLQRNRPPSPAAQRETGSRTSRGSPPWGGTVLSTTTTAQRASYSGQFKHSNQTCGTTTGSRRERSPSTSHCQDSSIDGVPGSGTLCPTVAPSPSRRVRPSPVPHPSIISGHATGSSGHPRSRRPAGRFGISPGQRQSAQPHRRAPGRTRTCGLPLRRLGRAVHQLASSPVTCDFVAGTVQLVRSRSSCAAEFGSQISTSDGAGHGCYRPRPGPGGSVGWLTDRRWRHRSTARASSS
jgi:hypothetical protein